MRVSEQIATHLREVFKGGNWTCSNFQEQLSGVTRQQAETKVSTLNTIHTLVRHMGYYVTVQLQVLKGEPLNASDEESFRHPRLRDDKDWETLVAKTLEDAEELAALVALLPDSKLAEDFTDKKYGSYYRNLHGLIEHTHYHLAQIALLKKLIARA